LQSTMVLPPRSCGCNASFERWMAQLAVPVLAAQAGRAARGIGRGGRDERDGAPFDTGPARSSILPLRCPAAIPVEWVRPQCQGGGRPWYAVVMRLVYVMHVPSIRPLGPGLRWSPCRAAGSPLVNWQPSGGRGAGPPCTQWLAMEHDRGGAPVQYHMQTSCRLCRPPGSLRVNALAGRAVSPPTCPACMLRM
jgi:hypothetical protein